MLSVCASFFRDAASWDGAVKMWDGKQPNPVWQQNVGAKVRKRGALTNRVVLSYQPSAASHWFGRHENKSLEIPQAGTQFCGKLNVKKATTGLDAEMHGRLI